MCPALNSQVRTWTSDEDGARAAAEARLRSSLDALTAAGVTVRGEIGDGDPLQALEDALRTFPADEIVISTHPVGRSHWLERGVVETARARFDVPITHVIGGGAPFAAAEWGGGQGAEAGGGGVSRWAAGGLRGGAGGGRRAASRGLSCGG